MKDIKEKAIALNNRNTARELSTNILIFCPSVEFEDHIYPASEIYLTRDDIIKLYEWIKKAGE